jgi:hypothetical protein
MQDSILGEKMLELIGSVFSPIVKLKLFDFSKEQIFYKQFEFDKATIDFTFT